jgi:glycosyltransferase involved in cell wall biosynthesis
MRVTDTKPTVSVIIPTYNRAGLLLEALASVLLQTVQDFEVLIVDDGSTDGTPERIAPLLTDARIRYLQQRNQGPAMARNHGIETAIGDTIAFLDSDDRWLPDKLEQQLQVLNERPEIGLVYTQVTWIDRHGAELDPQPAQAARRWPTYYEDLMFENVITGSDSAVLVRADALRRVAWYDPDLPTLEDQDLWLRLSMITEFACVDEPLVLLRTHGANIQHDPDNMARGRLHFLNKLKREAPQPYRHHLPDVEYVLYRRIVFGYLLKRKYLRSLRYTIQLFVRRPRCIGRLVADAMRRRSLVRSAQWQ